MKTKNKKVISLFDLHIPHNINLSGIMKFIKDEKPDYLILGGDIMNIDSLSHWALAGGKRLVLEGKRFKKECDIMNSFLTDLRKATGDKCKIVYLGGNHEKWVEQYVEQNPEMQGIIDLPLMLDLKNRKIKWIPYGKEDSYYKIGKLYYTHGDYTNKFHSAKMVYAWNCNIRYGHVHTSQSYTKPTKRGIGDLHKATSIPCLCEPKFDYLNGRATSWEHGFHYAIVKPNGNFHEYIVSIIDNEFIFNNKTY